MSNSELVKNFKMRTVLQRCLNAEVVIAEQSRGLLSSGLLLLIGFGQTSEDFSAQSVETFLQSSEDERARALEPLFQKWWDKVSQLRVFPDEQGRMNLSLLQQPASAGLYLISQFTLFADLRKGNRPSFSGALSAQLAKVCFEDLQRFVKAKIGERPLLSGVFAADMKVVLTNDGPVTLLFDCSVQEGVTAL